MAVSILFSPEVHGVCPVRASCVAKEYIALVKDVIASWSCELESLNFRLVDLERCEMQLPVFGGVEKVV